MPRSAATSSSVLSRKYVRYSTSRWAGARALRAFVRVTDDRTSSSGPAWHSSGRAFRSISVSTGRALLLRCASITRLRATVKSQGRSIARSAVPYFSQQRSSVSWTMSSAWCWSPSTRRDTKENSAGSDSLHPARRDRSDVSSPREPMTGQDMTVFLSRTNLRGEAGASPGRGRTPDAGAVPLRRRGDARRPSWRRGPRVGSEPHGQRGLPAEDERRQRRQRVRGLGGCDAGEVLEQGGQRHGGFQSSEGRAHAAVYSVTEGHVLGVRAADVERLRGVPVHRAIAAAGAEAQDDRFAPADHDA